MRTPERREIAGLAIEITPLGFEAQRRTFVVLARALGPALVEMLAGAKSLESLGSPDALRRAALAAIERLDDATLEALTEAFGESSRAMFAPKRAPFLSEASAREEAFAGPHFARFFLWLRACVEVNYGPFFASLGALIAPARRDETPAG
jgi:hypothetical protein